MKFLLTVLIAVLLISGCSSIETTTEPAAVPDGSPVATALPTGLVETAAPAVTEAPAPSPTPPPTAEPEMNSDPSASLALIQNYIPALAEFFGDDWSGSDIRGLDHDPASDRIVLSGCIYVCDDVMGGYPFLLLLDPGQAAPPRSLDINPSGRINDADFTPDGSRIVYSTRQGIMVYDLKADTSSVLWNAEALDYPPINDVSPDGGYLASNVNNSLLVFDLIEMQEVARIPQVYTSSYHVEYFNAAGNRLRVITDRDGLRVAVYAVPGWEFVREFTFPEFRFSAISPDGGSLATAQREGSLVSLINLADGSVLWQRDIPFDRVSALTFTPDGRLLVSGSPDESLSLFTSAIFFNAENGEEIGSLLYLTSFYNLLFINDGNQILALDGSAFGLWGVDTETQRAAADLVREYFDAVVSGDYQRAAAMTRLDDYAVMDVEDAGLNPDDLIDAFTQLCAEDEVPCLPLGEIAVINASDGEYWDYEALVTLLKPDGSIVMFDGIEPYEFIGIKLDDQGNMWIATLHPGMLYPFE